MALTIIGCASLVLTACPGAPVEEVCTMEADCWLKNCRWTEDACNAQVDERKQLCISEYNMELDALAVSKGESCRSCENSLTAFLECLDSLDSCGRFDVAVHDDGDCYQEYRDADSDCEDIEETCYL
jgi:hypothetical protein